MKILMAAGGTAGHINPAIAIAKYIAEAEKPKGCEVLFIGTEAGMEKELVKQAGFSIEFVEVTGLSKASMKKNISNVGKFIRSYKKTKEIIKSFKPDCCVATGGYVSGPVILAAKKMKVKTFIHEQNVIPGLTVKLLARKADVVLTSFPETSKYLKKGASIEVVGNPIRTEILETGYEEARKRLKLSEKPCVLFFSGSLGADRMNDALLGILAEKRDFSLIAATGKRNYEKVSKKIDELGLKTDGDKILPYIDNMNDCLAAADIVVSRAGALTISEITALGKPSILIPSPNVAHDHQTHNARLLADAGAAVMISEANLSSETLLSEINKLLSDVEGRKRMGEKGRSMGITDATNRIYTLMKS